MNTTGQEKIDVTFQALDIKGHRGIPFKRGYDCGKDAFEHE
jgi:hypothetical protein